MRTTVRLDDTLLRQAKKLAAETGQSLTAVIEAALREVVGRRAASSTRKEKIVFPIFKGRSLRPGFDLDNSAALLNVMEEGQ